MDQNYAFCVEGSEDKAVELKLEQRPAKGDVVSLKDGKRARVQSVELNLQTGKHDVKLALVPDAVSAISAEGNEPSPERHAVKDVLFDPALNPGRDIAAVTPGKASTEGVATTANTPTTPRTRAETHPSAVSNT